LCGQLIDRQPLTNLLLGLVPVGDGGQSIRGHVTSHGREVVMLVDFFVVVSLVMISVNIVEGVELVGRVVTDRNASSLSG
jgi:hypothetical protein